MIQFGKYNQLVVGPEDFIFEERRYSYRDVNDFAYSDTVYSVNAVPTQEVFKIFIYLNGGREIKVVEKADARPALFRTPITKLFRPKERKAYKNKLSEGRIQSRKAFITILNHLRRKTGLEGTHRRELV